MLRRPHAGVLTILVALILIPAGGGAIPVNVDVSQRAGNEAEEAIAGERREPRGTLRIAAPLSFSTLHLNAVLVLCPAARLYET